MLVFKLEEQSVVSVAITIAVSLLITYFHGIFCLDVSESRSWH